jgi:hypothetical protein
MDIALLYDANRIWGPTHPRQTTFSNSPNQVAVHTQAQAIENLINAAQSGGPGYISAYSFPRGHSRDDEVPEIDTLFIDMDIPHGVGEYDPQNGGTLQEWKRDMSALLVRARMIANEILDLGLEDYFRVSLSGHKGIHLFIDFEPLDADLGTLTQYKSGLQVYAENLMSTLDEAAGGVGIEQWVDVTSHDLGRLVRHPNTPHHGAKHVDHTPFCVAVTVRELSQMTPDKYLRATREPRPLPKGVERVPSERARRVLTENIKNASSRKRSRSKGQSVSKNYDRLQDYNENANEKITVEAITDLLTRDKPCIKAWAEREDAYDYGQASRTMEIQVIKELAKHQVPIDTMLEFFSQIPGSDVEAYDTRFLIEDIISRYTGPMVCTNILNECPQFCLKSGCGIYNRSEDLQQIA